MNFNSLPEEYQEALLEFAKVLAQWERLKEEMNSLEKRLHVFYMMWPYEDRTPKT
ncbi:hypothetical protein LJC27_05320 [Christensenellaceae bacterium OttesenSCG-928-M15]|nr:hypothetical protein [Christensenellaceae bacterium OttesenSCG-928-M15]